MVMDPSTTTRKRNAEATRQALIEAARELFGERGYESVGLREIAAKAGVNIALINRYFGSKKGLFEAAIPPTLTPDLLASCPSHQIATLAAQIMVGKSYGPDVYDRTLALVRSAGAEDARDSLRQSMDARVIAKIAENMNGPDREIRAALVVSSLLGYDMLARILGSEAITKADPAILRSLLEAQLKTLTEPDS